MLRFAAVRVNNTSMNTADGAPTGIAGAVASPAEVLRWCAAAAPELWFPSAESQGRGVPRASLDEPIRQLREGGLIHVADWVRGRGQGYAVTADGVRALTEPPTVPRPMTEPEGVSPNSELPPGAVLTPYDRGELTREAFLAPRPAIVVPILLAGLAVWYLVAFVVAWRMGVPLGAYLQAVDVGPEPYANVGAAAGPDLLRGEYWRLGTCGFVHIGLLHLLGNLFALALLGPVAEGLWGRWRFLGLYLLAGFAAACAGIALHPTVLIAGASGSVWGVQIAVVAWLIRFREHLPAATLAEWTRRLLLVLGVSTVISLTPGVCWECLVAGASAGFIGGVFLDLTRPGARLWRKLVGGSGLVAFAIGLVGGLALIVHDGSDWEPLRKLPLNRAPELDASPESTAIPGSRVNALHKKATIALIARVPAARTATLEENAALAAEATQALARVPATSSAARYLAEVLRYTQMLQTRLSVERLPTPDECRALAERRAAVEVAWTFLASP